MEAEGSECECWRFMSAAGGPSAQHRGSDSWAACGRQREQGKGRAGEALESRGQGRKEDNSPHPYPPPRRSCGKSEVRGPRLLAKV